MKIFITLCVLIIALSGWFALNTAYTPSTINMLDVNSTLQYIENNYPNTPTGTTFLPVGASLHTHIQNQDVLIPVFVQGEMVGSLLLTNHRYHAVAGIRHRFITIFITTTGLLAATFIVFALYQHATLVRPFRKLQKFAAAVAAGNLDAPLAMDKRNRFGAFTESFDLMRQELAAARDRERQANQSKKELVATLSHDIKTPAAAIKIMAELAAAKSGTSQELTTIIEKVDTIDHLITNMFSATLEELTQLAVSPTDVTTTDITTIIKGADFKHMLTPFTLPDCIVHMDPLRFGQIMDNLINNAYKYAGTPITVAGDIEGNHFILTIQDRGAGVSAEALPLLKEKFYRAPNAQGQNGAGLGLHLVNYFMEAMGGTVSLANHHGLLVTLVFDIS